MLKYQTSLTALGIAVMRAVESEKPIDERICYSPYARQFVPAWMYLIFGFFIKSGYAERRGPGVNGFLAARDHYIDDVLISFLEEGLKQLVILGKAVRLSLTISTRLCWIEFRDRRKL